MVSCHVMMWNTSHCRARYANLGNFFLSLETHTHWRHCLKKLDSNFTSFSHDHIHSENEQEKIYSLHLPLQTCIGMMGIIVCFRIPTPGYNFVHSFSYLILQPYKEDIMVYLSYIIPHHFYDQMIPYNQYIRAQ